jgi:predicted DNA-binding transcriptional regulator AlpA
MKRNRKRARSFKGVAFPGVYLPPKAPGPQQLLLSIGTESRVPGDPTPQFDAKQPPSDTDSILTTRQVVAITGHHRCTLYRWMEAGKFPRRHVFRGLKTGWRRSEITSWLAGDDKD